MRFLEKNTLMFDEKLWLSELEKQQDRLRLNERKERIHYVYIVHEERMIYDCMDGKRERKDMHFFIYAYFSSSSLFLYLSFLPHPQTRIIRTDAAPIAGMETRAMRIEGGGGRRGRPTTISKNMRKDYDYIPSHTSNLLVPLPIITVYHGKVQVLKITM